MRTATITRTETGWTINSLPCHSLDSAMVLLSQWDGYDMSNMGDLRDGLDLMEVGENYTLEEPEE